MKSHPFVAHLCCHNPALPIFPDGVPIRSLVAVRIDVEGLNLPSAYLVAWEKLDAGQKSRVAALYTRLQGGWIHEFLDFMHDGGELPLRADQVRSVSGDIRFFLP